MTRDSVARNTLLNGLTQVGLILLSFISYPFIANGVSADGFGLLALIWMLIGYLGLFDLGLSWAATRSIAQALALADADRAARIGWNALFISGILGIVIGVTLYFTKGVLVHTLFEIDPHMQAEANESLTLVSIAIPFAVVNGITRGLLQGEERFGILNALQAGMAAVQWIGSIAAVLLGYGVVHIVFITVCARIAFTLIGLAVQHRLLPGMYQPKQLIEPGLIREVMAFGGWVTVSRVISPLFLYIDRLLIGSLLTLEAVGYYTVPQETVSRLLIIPMALTMALYPAFSSSHAGANKQKLTSLYNSSLKYLFLLGVPISLVLGLFSFDILRLWIGSEFADGGAVSMQIMAIGLLFNSVAQVPMTLLLSVGRPDLPARFHMIELPVAVVLSLVLLDAYGIAGAAVSWTLRVIVDAFLLMNASRRMTDQPFFRSLSTIRWPRFVYYIVLLCAGLLLLISLESFVAKGLALAAMAAFYCVGVWKHALDDGDREMVRGILLQRRPPAG